MRFPIALASGAIATILLGGAYVVRDTPSENAGIGLLAIVLMAAIIGRTIADLEPKAGSVNVAFSNPRGLYGAFYLLYYVFPYLIMLFAGNLPEGNESLIACLIGIAFVSWRAGVGPPRTKGPIQGKATNSDGRAALFLVCIIGIGFVAYLYIWRIANGTFYTHARYYEQSLTVGASFRDVFIGGLQLPIIVVLGAVGSAADGRITRLARRVLLWYGICMITLFVLSSQTRPAITALILVVASRELSTSVPIKVRQVLAMVAVSLLLLLGVQGGRIVGQAALEDADNQLTHALANVISNTASAVLESPTEMQAIVLDRAGGGIKFLSDVIDGLRKQGRFLYGEDVRQTLFQLIPRMLWAEKPSVVPPQLVVEELLGLPQEDAAYGPIPQFYAWGGAVSLGLCYFVFGWGLGRMARWATLSRNMGRWILFAFVIGQVVNLELEVTLGLLTVLRNAVVVFAIWRTIAIVFARGETWPGRSDDRVAELGKC